MKPMILKIMSSNGRIQGLSAELLIMMELNDSPYSTLYRKGRYIGKICHGRIRPEYLRTKVHD